MTKTVQLCLWATRSKTDKDLSIGKDLTKAEAEEKLNFLLSAYDMMSQMNLCLNKLDYELKKTCKELSNYYEKAKEGR